MVAAMLALLLSALVAGAGCSSAKSGAPAAPAVVPTPLTSTTLPAGPLAVIIFRSPTGTEARLSVTVEATEADRERGLMNVQTLPADQGDLFFWRDVSPNQDVFAPFWMKDTLVPLTVAFISADGRVLEEQDMQPQTLVLHAPRQPYRYAVEANLGWFARHGLPPGSTVDLSAALSR